MLRYGLTAMLAAMALTTPVPQDLDWDGIEQLDPPPSPSIPVVNAVAAQTTIIFKPTAAAAAVEAAVLADPEDTTVNARDAAPITGYSNQTQCHIFKNPNDTPEYFQNNRNISNAASSAQTPQGYQLAYQNKNGSSIGVYGYMGFSTLPSYDVQECSNRCDAVTACQSFNIYFERDPAEEPRAGCTDPASVTVIKCVYYSGPVTEASATNDGQWRADFHVLIGGSNGYVNHSISPPNGYNIALSLGNAAINAPLDCNARDTYMGVKLFQSGPFSVDNCAAACTAQSDYNRMHPGPDGAPVQTCQFFNTYILYNDSIAVAQYCALYSESWPAAFATNVGQWRGDAYFSIGYSYAFSNSTADADKPRGCVNPTSPRK